VTVKPTLIKLHWLLSSQFGVDPQRFLRSLRGLPSYLRDWAAFRKGYAGRLKLRPCLHDRYEEGGATKSEYFWQDLLVARAIHDAKPVKHVDIGSRVDGFVAWNLTHLGGLVSIESFKPSERPLTQREANRLLSSVDIFSSNWEEAVSMFGSGLATSVIGRMCDAGNSLITLRMGADGALIMEEAEAGIIHIPPYRVEVIDPVGAGNAFCGGFLVGLKETDNLLIAGCYGAVAASFIVEQVGLPQLSSGLRQEAFRRLKELESQVKNTHKGELDL